MPEMPSQDSQEQLDAEKHDKAGDEHMFEQFLKAGQYQHLGKRQRDNDEFDEDELVFGSGIKR